MDEDKKQELAAKAQELAAKAAMDHKTHEADQQAVEKFNATYRVPPEKVASITLKGAEFRRKFPGMSTDRLLRKVAEFYNLKKK